MKSIIAILITCLSLLLSASIRAQESRFFMPTEIREAYANGTRSYNGQPGPNYWQNTADYTIAVAVDVKLQQLDGEETVVYYNNSPNELNTLVLRLYNDVYRKNSERRSDIPESGVTNGVELREVTINGVAFDLSSLRRRARSNTLVQIPLKEPLKPGARLEFGVKWTTQIPDDHIRAGVSDSSAFFVGYWYPQVAVYDDVFGWDDMPYDLQSEFYNNLANFDVTITAPDDFLVWATGELQNADAIYPPQVLERYRKAQTSQEPAMIVAAEDLEAGYRNRSGSWHYKAAEVSDFAFALSDHYLWEAAAQPVGDRLVRINSIYPARRAKECTGLTAVQQKAMKHFSEHMPGVPYPYPAFTTFIGTFGGGMEFPMMANNDGPRTGVTVHEMFHTYFPMYVRINEKRFAWMDEGWASYGTSIVTRRYFQENKEPFFTFSGPMSGNTGSLGDLPLITSTQFLDGSNYGYASYPLPAFVYGMLHQHLGEELFMRCFREYIRRWAKKSPTPYDFFYTFENVSGQDLSWLWKPWFFEFGYPDMAIKSLKSGKLTIEKRGTRPTPLHATVKYKNGETKDLYASAAVWKKNKVYQMAIPGAATLESIELNSDIPDMNVLDNYYPPLAERYKKFSLPGSITGMYTIDGPPSMQIEIEWKDGLLAVYNRTFSNSTYLVPTGDTRLQSLDGSLTIDFAAGDGPVSELQIKNSMPGGRKFEWVAKRM